MPSGKLGLVLVIVGVVLLVIGLLFTVLNTTPSTDYTEDDMDDPKFLEDLMNMKEGDEYTILIEDINKSSVDWLNENFEGTSFSEGDTVVITYEVTSAGIQPKEAQIVGGSRMMIGLVLLIVGIVLMVVGIMIKMKAKKAAGEAPPPGAAPPPPPQPPQY